MTRWARATQWGAVLLVATWPRLAVFPKVLVAGVSPANGDSEYHLRRLLLAWGSFPRLSVFDPLLGWPLGHAHPWAPGFDWVGALWLHLTLAQSPESLSLAAAVYPVLLGLVTVWLVMDLTRRLLPAGAPLATPAVAGLLAALVPQFVGISRLARTDHHVWEALSVALLLRWVLSERDPAWRFELRGLFAAVVALGGFVGGPLYLALVTPLLLVPALLETERAVLWGSGLPALLVSAGLVALINAGPISEHGQVVSFGFPSLLQPALAVGAAAVVGLTVLISRRVAGPRARVGWLLLGLAGLAAAGLGVPVLGPQVRAGLGQWLFKQDPWLSSISEFQPLFSIGRAWLDAILYFFGVTGLLALPLLAVTLWRDRRWQVAGFAAVVLGLVALTVLQTRFGRVLAPLLGVAVALGAAGVLQWRTVARPGALLLIGVLGLSALDPEVRKELVLADDRPVSPIEQLSDGLKLSRAAEPGHGDGVLANWELGDTLLSRARRPVVASGFGSYVDPEGFAASAQAFATDEAALLEVMQRRDLGAVVTGASELLKDRAAPRLLTRVADGVRFDLDALTHRPIAVLLAGGSGVPGVALHAEHLMPTQASDEHLPGVDWPIAALWSFERVAGATVTFGCTPGQPATATLPARVGDRPFTFVAWGRCPPDGQVTLRLAVPSGAQRPGFSTAPRWLLPEREVAVDEATIRAGAAR